MLNVAEMGKVELRAACKEAGISYGKLDNAGMRAALTAKADADAAFAAPVRTAPKHDAAHYVELAKKMDLTALGTDGIEGHCPCCGIDLANGVWTQDDANDAAQAKDWLKQKGSIGCLGCNGTWGPAPVQPEADRHTGTGLKIEKVREERNGVKRPSAGGKCRAVWDALDALQAELEEGEKVTSAMVKDLANDEGWNPNNASIEFYQWRKFNGISKGSK